MAPSAGSILAGYRLLAWLFPARPLAELTTEPYEQLCLKYKRRDFWGNWIGCLATVVLVAVYFLVMLVVGRWITSGVPREHYVGPVEFLYVVAAFFLSLFSSGWVVFGLLRVALGKPEYDLYLAYGGETLRRSC